MLISHPEFWFGEEIVRAFKSIPIPDKFNDHNLNRRVLKSIKHDKKSVKEPLELTRFLYDNAIGRRMVAKWYNRDMASGAFNFDLVAQRGYYGASFDDIELAKNSSYGYALLADSGEELIDNTFVLISDIYYTEKDVNVVQAADWSRHNAMVAEAAEAMGVKLSTSRVAQPEYVITKKIVDFKVVVVTHLYKLDFNEDVMWEFYMDYYFDDKNPSPQRKAKFDSSMDLFKLIYVGSQITDSGKTSTKGVNLDTPEQMIRKVCCRAIDKSIAALQRENEVFRVKTPLYEVTPELRAKIGLKEGVDEHSLFEVLERKEENGRTSYSRIGVIRPVKGKIWDNRFMAVEEEAENSLLGYTSFEVVRGGGFYKGAMIRQIYE